MTTLDIFSILRDHPTWQPVTVAEQQDIIEAIGSITRSGPHAVLNEIFKKGRTASHKVDLERIGEMTGRMYMLGSTPSFTRLKEIVLNHRHHFGDYCAEMYDLYENIYGSYFKGLRNDSIIIAEGLIVYMLDNPKISKSDKPWDICCEANITRDIGDLELCLQQCPESAIDIIIYIRDIFEKSPYIAMWDAIKMYRVLVLAIKYLEHTKQ